MVPAMFLQPFLVLLQAEVTEAPANATGPLLPVAGPLGKEQGHTPAASHQDHDVPTFTSSPRMNQAHCCSSPFHCIPLPVPWWLHQADHCHGDGTSHLLVAPQPKAGPPFLELPKSLS